ncbi:MAG: D-alanine--D-alanine ligase [Leptospirillia bacterium]
MTDIRSRHVVVLMGGRSSEREISLTSGRAAARALAGLGHRVTEIDAGADTESYGGLAGRLAELSPDVVFIALHGRFGEDGTIQGLLELLGIPYTGSGLLASAVATHKLMSKRLMVAAGIPTPAFEEVYPDTLSLTIPYPVVLKPNRGGSSIGIREVKGPESLAGALDLAFAEDEHAYAEAMISGREVTVSVLAGNPLPIVEIVPPAGIFSFEAKYGDAGTRYVVPAELKADVATTVSEVALATYRTLDCAGAARVDLMLDADMKPWVLEINTIPGMTPTSLLPKAAGAVGMSFSELIQHMLDAAVTPS